MSSSLPNLRFLRPYLHDNLPAVRSAAYARFSSSKTKSLGEEVLLSPYKPLGGYRPTKAAHFKGDVQGRMREMKAANALDWPRVRSDPSALTVREFANRYKEMQTAEKREGEYVTLRGTRALLAINREFELLVHPVLSRPVLHFCVPCVCCKRKTSEQGLM
jgi:hypothetical protein